MWEGVGVRRVVVIGVAGVGKSTVARALGERLGVRHVELDSMFWQAGWVKLAQEEFEGRVREATAAGRWVVDGNYSARIREIAWGAADTVVWLDLPRYVVMWQLVLRTLRRSPSGTHRRRRSMAERWTTRGSRTCGSCGSGPAGTSNGSSDRFRRHRTRVDRRGKRHPLWTTLALVGLVRSSLMA
jgi:adenylate kinase family enzyme